jgi:predicted nucleotidyltransferase
MLLEIKIALGVTNMVDISDNKLREIVSRLVAEFQPEKVYLFGSKAREDGNEDSDYDLLLIVSNDVVNSPSSYGRVSKVLWGTEVATDVLLWSKDEFEKRLHLKASFPSTVVREGKLLHAS